jgi:hypothetical protein
MVRPKKDEKDKKIKILISLDKSIYNNLKKDSYKVSTYINQMLKVALNKDIRSKEEISNSDDSSLVRTRSRVQISSGAYR